MRISDKFVFVKRCCLCGAEVYSESENRGCYKCGSKMIVLTKGWRSKLK